MTDDGVLHRPVRPVRDRTTLLAYAQLGLLGWFIYAFGASVTLLRDDEGLTRTAASTRATTSRCRTACGR